MKIIIENYYGSDILTIKFKLLTSKSLNDETLNTINKICAYYDFMVADIDTGDEVRIQDTIERIMDERQRHVVSGIAKDLIYKFM